MTDRSACQRNRDIPIRIFRNNISVEERPLPSTTLKLFAILLLLLEFNIAQLVAAVGVVASDLPFL